MSKCSDKWGGSLNVFRLVNKRCKQVVESCTTKLTNRQVQDGPDSLPVALDERCRRIDQIRCGSHNLRSLEGCPNGLKRLDIGFAPHLSDLSPLASCSMMECLEIGVSSVTDISVVSSMPLLEVFICGKEPGGSSMRDISPLSSCLRLKSLNLNGNSELKDLSPLSACTALEELEISFCPLITSLAPLSTLKTLGCTGIDPQTSLLPLASCTGLKQLWCSPVDLELEELRRRMPKLDIICH